MFGIGKNKSEQKPDFETPATYYGGHKMYPKTHTCKLKIFADRVEITKPELTIPFTSMSKVEYTQKPQFGLMHTSVKVFTVIEYFDGRETQRIVLWVADVIGARNLEKTQAMLYERMHSAKQA